MWRRETKSPSGYLSHHNVEIQEGDIPAVMDGSLHRNFFSCRRTALKTGGIKLPGNGIPFPGNGIPLPGKKIPHEKGQRTCPLACEFMVAGAGFEPATFGL